jgi:hypothetical protein
MARLVRLGGGVVSPGPPLLRRRPFFLLRLRCRRPLRRLSAAGGDAGGGPGDGDRRPERLESLDSMLESLVLFERFSKRK